MKTKYQTKLPNKLFNFQKADTNNLKSKVLKFTQEFLNWNPIKNSVDTNWVIIQHNQYTIMDATVSWKLSHGKRHLPTISLSIKCSMRRRDNLHCKARKYQDVVHWDHFRQWRNKVAKMVPIAHYNYINHTIGDRLTEQPKSSWSYAKLMRTENIGIPTIRIQTKQCTTGKKADTLNELFLSVFAYERNVNIPDKGQSPFPDIPDLIMSAAGA